jgi:hypothetical protein
MALALICHLLALMLLALAYTKRIEGAVGFTGRQSGLSAKVAAIHDERAASPLGPTAG